MGSRGFAVLWIYMVLQEIYGKRRITQETVFDGRRLLWDVYISRYTNVGGYG